MNVLKFIYLLLSVLLIGIITIPLGIVIFLSTFLLWALFIIVKLFCALKVVSKDFPDALEEFIFECYGVVFVLFIAPLIFLQS